MNFPIFGLMFIIMFALKLAGTITFSWWIVTAPLWGPFLLFVVIFLFSLCGLSVASRSVRRRGRRR